MGSGFSKRLAVLGLCLGLVALLVHGRAEPRSTVKPLPLGQALSRVGSWDTAEELGFADRIVEALQLDDYIHRTYTDGEDTVWVYVGYYLAGNSIGASHSPLVCYPGQGWRISDKRKVTLDTDSGRLRLMSMSAAKGTYEDVVLYWFQAYDRNAPDTFSQKLQAMWARVTTGRADSAFVRISVPVGPGGRDEARRTALAFARVFYPVFLAYVTEDDADRPGTLPGDSRG